MDTRQIHVKTLFRAAIKVTSNELLVTPES